MKSFKIKLKRKELYEHRFGLSLCSNIETEVYELVEAVTESLDALEDKIKKIEKAKEPSKEVKEYEEKLLELRMKHSSKGDDGNPIRYQISNTQYQIAIADDKEEAFKKEVASLQQSYKSVLQAQRNKEDGFDKALAREIEITLYGIDKAWIKSIQKINPSIMKALKILVNKKG